MQPVDARSLAPNVPQPLDTRRIEIPLYIVLDPVKLPDAMTATGQGVKPIEVSGLPTRSSSATCSGRCRRCS